MTYHKKAPTDVESIGAERPVNPAPTGAILPLHRIANMKTYSDAFHYDKKRAAFSDLAHAAAVKQIYPRAFQKPRSNTQPKITIDKHSDKNNDRSTFLDGRLGIDCTIKLENDTFNAPLVITMQERFRRPKNRRWREVTIREWNNAFNLPGELHKIASQMFLSAYYDEKAGCFHEAIIFNVSDLVQMLATSNIKFSRASSPDKMNQFVAIEFSELMNSGAVRYYRNWHDGTEWWA